MRENSPKEASAISIVCQVKKLQDPTVWRVAAATADEEERI
jgi:hypothetical protein